MQINQQIDLKFQELKFIESRFAGLNSSYNTNHPVIANQSYFDEVTSNAGGAILRMIEQAVTPAAFKTAIGKYLKDNKFESADENTLKDAFKEVESEFKLITSVSDPKWKCLRWFDH
jgi:aminopeptidase N